HTCAPRPPPLTMDDLVMSTSVFDEAFSRFKDPEVDVVSYVSRKDLHSIKFIKTPPELPKPYNVPYTYSKTSNPSADPFDSLSNQFYCDLLRLSELRNKFLVFPSDVDAEIYALKSKLSDLLEEIGQEIMEEIGQRGMEVARLMMDVVERASQKRLTLYSHAEFESTRSEAEAARKAADDMLLQALRDCRMESELINRLEAQRIEQERLAQETVLLIEYPEDVGSSSDKGKAPMESDVDKLKVLEEAIGAQRSDHQVLASKVDSLDSKVDDLHTKFDQIIVLLSKP
ncbi:hypothetical protein L195_g042043, partial [Trifolium pratense]